MFVQAGVGFYSFGVLLKPLMNELGLSRGMVSVAQSIFLFTGAAIGLFLPRLVERYGVKRIVLLGAVTGGTSFFLLSLMNSSWHLYILYCFLGLGLGGGAGIIPPAMAISNWFLRRKGTAMGIAMAGIALGAMILAPLVGLVIEGFGWRTAYISMGLVVFIVDIPLALLVLRMSPQEMGLLPDGDKPREIMEVPTGESPGTPVAKSTGAPEQRSSSIDFKSLPLWFLSIGLALAHIGESSILTHEVPFITDIGIPVTMAATALGFTGGIGGIGKVTFGWLADRLSTRYVLILCFGLQLVGVLILLRTHTMAMVWLFVVVFGFAMGGVVTLIPLAVWNRFGMSNFGVTYGFVNFVATIGSTAGPLFAGFMFDATGSYSVVFTIFAITYAVSIVAIYFTWGRGPRPIRNLKRI